LAGRLSDNRASGMTSRRRILGHEEARSRQNGSAARAYMRAANGTRRLGGGER